jgi:hypothetical protein
LSNNPPLGQESRHQVLVTIGPSVDLSAVGPLQDTPGGHLPLAFQYLGVVMPRGEGVRHVTVQPSAHNLHRAGWVGQVMRAKRLNPEP